MPLVDDVLAFASSRWPNQPERLAAIRSLLHAIEPVVRDDAETHRLRLLERLVVPERSARFRVTWEADDGSVHVNEGWRIVQSTLLGPGKGGLRFHGSVNESVIAFLAFEQQFKNALTGLPIGGAKGGSDFDPRRRSAREIRRFCDAFARGLAPWIGPQVDVPAGDIGVGSREIGWMQGTWRNLTRSWDGTFTGKGEGWGGSPLRPEATGWGLVFFVAEMLAADDASLEGQRVAVSGAGNVALHTVERLLHEGAVPICLSDSEGCLDAEDGFSWDAFACVRDGRARGDRLASFDGRHGLRWREGGSAWEREATIALPCATQNELDADDAQRLIDAGCTLVAEGANMPCTEDATEKLLGAGVRFAPGKASNAGGVSVSALEMAQNATFTPWTRDDVESRLREIMRGIHMRARDAAASTGDARNLVRGADIAGWQRLRAAMIAQGLH